MIIGERLRAIREQKRLSQGDIEKATGLLRCYISRVENGHTVPAIETMEKFARALDIPMYQLFYDGEKPPEVQPIEKPKKQTLSRPVQRQLDKLDRLFPQLDERSRTILVGFAVKMAEERKTKGYRRR